MIKVIKGKKGSRDDWEMIVELGREGHQFGKGRLKRKEKKTKPKKEKRSSTKIRVRNKKKERRKKNGARKWGAGEVERETNREKQNSKVNVKETLECSFE